MSIGFEKMVLKPKFWDGFETGLKSLKPVLLQYYKMVKKRLKRALQKLKIIINNHHKKYCIKLKTCLKFKKLNLIDFYLYNTILKVF